MRSLLTVLGWSLVMLLLPYGVVLHAELFNLDPTGSTDTVFFRSSARLEFIEGITTDVSGGFQFDPENVADAISGGLQVDLRTMKTGIETRDGHMRDRHLHTKDYPFAFFELTQVEGLPARLATDTTYRAISHGLFYIHGVKRHLEADLEVRYLAREPGVKRLDIRVSFELKLDDYKIDRPKALFFKLAETMEIDVIFSSYNNLPASDIHLPQWETLP